MIYIMRRREARRVSAQAPALQGFATTVRGSFLFFGQLSARHSLLLCPPGKEPRAELFGVIPGSGVP